MDPIARVVENPRLLIEAARNVPGFLIELNRLYYRQYGPEYNRTGTDVFEEDWDNLIILDACRYDYYDAVTEFEGPVESRTSRGSASPEFIRGNFGDKTLHDVVYVSGNRWFLKLRDELDYELHAYRDVERDFYVEMKDDPNPDEGYVPFPETVLDAAADAAEEYPHKRLIVHLMQPHKPYLGPHREKFTYDGGVGSTVKASGVGIETLREAYRDTLEITLDAVASTVGAIDGRTVITADHGEMLGERLSPVPVRVYGHPEGVYVPELVEVPWHVVKQGPRRQITAEAPEAHSEVDQEEVEESLRALGYVP